MASEKKHHSSQTNPFEIRNIQEIIKLEQRDRISMSASDRVASSITAFSGSMTYVIIHVIIFLGWIVWNTGILGTTPFDPFPFNLLTMSVSLEAIFLSAFVLISQNKQAIQADKRAKIDLQVNMIAEQESTKLISMIAEIQQHLGIHKREDAEIRAMRQHIDVNELADSIDKAEEKAEGHALEVPESAADISK